MKLRLGPAANPEASKLALEAAYSTLSVERLKADKEYNAAAADVKEAKDSLLKTEEGTLDEIDAMLTLMAMESKYKGLEAKLKSIDASMENLYYEYLNVD